MSAVSGEFLNITDNKIVQGVGYVIAPAYYGFQRIAFACDILQSINRAERADGWATLDDNSNHPKIVNYANELKARSENQLLSETDQGIVNALGTLGGPGEIKSALRGQILRGVVEIIATFALPIIVSVCLLIKDLVTSHRPNRQNYGGEGLNYSYSQGLVEENRLFKMNVGNENRLIEIRAWQSKIGSYAQAEGSNEKK